eukprot:1923477-Rhodomonas_salina.1
MPLIWPAGATRSLFSYSPARPSPWQDDSSAATAGTTKYVVRRTVSGADARYRMNRRNAAGISQPQRELACEPGQCGVLLRACSEL